MVRKHHKILSVILCLMLAITAISAGTVAAFAASGDTVYVKVNNGWYSSKTKSIVYVNYKYVDGVIYLK